MQNDNNFIHKMYFKGELAMLYFPDSSKRNAAQNLKRWIKNCHGLTAALTAMGYSPTRKFFSRQEVDTIVKYLGEP